MNYCFSCRKELPETYPRHWFAGYGFYLTYCAECCPREMDGSDCEEHEDNHEQANS